MAETQRNPAYENIIEFWHSLSNVMKFCPHQGGNCPLFLYIHPITHPAGSQSFSTSSEWLPSQSTHDSSGALILLIQSKPSAWALGSLTDRQKNWHAMPATSLWMNYCYMETHRVGMLKGDYEGELKDVFLWMGPSSGTLSILVNRIFQMGLRLALLKRLLALYKQCD